MRESYCYLKVKWKERLEVFVRLWRIFGTGYENVYLFFILRNKNTRLTRDADNKSRFDEIKFFYQFFVVIIFQPTDNFS